MQDYPGFNVVNNSCFGDTTGSVSVSVPISNYNYFYSWSSGENTALITNKTAGTYILKVDIDTFCFSIDTIVIQQPPEVISPFNDTSFCETDSFLINPGNNFQNIIWLDGYTGFTRWIKTPLDLVIKVQDLNGCWSSLDTFSIKKDSMISLNLGNDTSLCYGENMTIRPDKIYQTYVWNDQSQNSELAVNSTGLYWLEVSNGACKVRDSILIFDCVPILTYPNVFTPNDDGINDLFGPIEYQNVLSYQLEIFNRWGDLVYSTSEIENFWSGKIKGEKGSEGVYFFKVRYTLYNGRVNQNYLYQQGSVTLIAD